MESSNRVSPALSYEYKPSDIVPALQPNRRSHFVYAALTVKATIHAPALAGTPPFCKTGAYFDVEKIGQKIAMGTSWTSKIYERTMRLSILNA